MAIDSGQTVSIFKIGKNNGHNNELYTLELGKILRFVLHDDLIGHTVKLFTNAPLECGVPFDRSEFREVMSKAPPISNKAIVQTHVGDIPTFQSGAFEFYYEYDINREDDKKNISTIKDWFVVEPKLSVKGSPLPLDAICMQTVLVKSLGNIKDWKARLKVSAECGFNFVHFTPVQVLGSSRSSYSVADQLNLNVDCFEGSKDPSADLAEVINWLEKEQNVLSLSDVVWNHTAHNSKWLLDHPEAGYNLVNSPHLIPAYDLDEVILRFSHNIVQGFVPISLNNEEAEFEFNKTKIIKDAETVDAIMSCFADKVLPLLSLWEYFVLDVKGLTEKFRDLIKNSNFRELSDDEKSMKPEIRFKLRVKKLASTLSGNHGSRFNVSVCLDKAKELFLCYTKDGDQSVDRVVNEFQKALDVINLPLYEVYDEDIEAALMNMKNKIKHERLDGHGPHYGKPISDNCPLINSYFTRLKNIENERDPNNKYDYNVEDLEADNLKFVVACNGWIWGGSDPLKDFALPDSKVYLRREVIIWGDCVKLRYGKCKADSPYLWEHMEKYTELTAKVFHGLRIDNCHSTPIHVASHLLDVARKIRPNLYVSAELFTGSESSDNAFVKQLGIDSLVREAMSAPDCKELGRLVHRYGGKPIGSFSENYKGIDELKPTRARALFVDTTHDNEPPILKRTVFDTLTNAAIVSMSACGVASNRGYDEFVPHYIDVVNESRPYAPFGDEDNTLPHPVKLDDAMLRHRKVLNDLHVEMAKNTYSEIYVDQVDKDVITVTRHCPKTRNGIILVAYSAFYSISKHHKPYINPITIFGDIEEVVLEACVESLTDNQQSPIKPAVLTRKASLATLTQSARNRFQKSSEFINGLDKIKVFCNTNLSYTDDKIKMFTTKRIVEEGVSKLIVDIDTENFRPGSIFILRTTVSKEARKAIATLNTPLNQSSKLVSSMEKLTLREMNRILYRCEAEEKDEENGNGVYDVPGFGPFVYAGLQGIMSVVDTIATNNDLAHPLCGNIRDGFWLVDSFCARIQRNESTKELGKAVEETLRPLKLIPFFLVPTYFSSLFSQLQLLLEEHCYKLMNAFICNGDRFIHSLALCSIQMNAALKSAPCRDPLLPTQFDSTGEEPLDLSMSMCAGLPHFSSGFMRAWGRDTFISLRGLLLTTGRYDVARNLIVGFAGTARHGLIPNLLDASRNSRFNCRDAVWFWLQSVQDYCNFAEEGVGFLNTVINRLYPSDDIHDYKPGDRSFYAYDGSKSNEITLKDLIHYIMESHARGIHFTEWGAGDRLDRNMSMDGFKIDIELNRENGFVYGGSSSNCGTWMDKMGGSEKAGNKGRPGTPRDGADIEIIGLLKSALRWICELNNTDPNIFGHSSINFNNDGEKMTYKEWNDKIQNNFEKYFYIPIAGVNDNDSYCYKKELAHRTGVYKDTVGSSSEYADYQLRPNICIAMTVAPEMFDKGHATYCLEVIENTLLGPLGMRTLDPSDWNYRGDYDNSNDGFDPTIAQGINYHQGPEWVWPTGYFLRAKLIFQTENMNNTINNIHRILNEHRHHIKHSPWRGLHELTNSNGKNCHHSCPTQAWSASCLLDCLYDIAQL